MKNTKSSRTAKASASETRQTIRLVAPPTPKQIEEARSVLLRASFLRLNQLDAEVEEEFCKIISLAPEGGPLGKAIENLSQAVNDFSNARFAAANLANQLKGGSR